MKWTPGAPSGNVEDRRGEPASGGGGGGGLPLGFLLSRFGVGGTVLIVIGYIAIRALLSSGGGATPTPAGAPAGAVGAPDPDQHIVAFMSFVLDDAQRFWGQELPRRGRSYVPAKLVLFTADVDTGCGTASADVGPFYCPRDQKVYLDVSFFRDLDTRFGAPGDFAQAYVLAHEIGHHVQQQLGVSDYVEQSTRASPGLENELSVKLELQADCYAGIWGHSTRERNILDPGDVEEGLRAAAAVGDDRLQRAATGRVRPESFTHGTSEQRARWFRRGFETGQLESCDTFNAAPL